MQKILTTAAILFLIVSLTTIAAAQTYGPPTNSIYPPKDLDNDGLFEDVDGDEELDIFDTQAFFKNRSDPEIKNYGYAYDFHLGDGEVDISKPEDADPNINDLQELYDMVT